MPPSIAFPAHGLIVVALLGTAASLSMLLRLRPDLGRAVRFSLGGILALNELIWYGYRLHTEGFRFPDELPLQLCDLCVWLTVISAVTLRPGVYEVAYFGGLGGSSMALLTPDLWAAFPSYPTTYFFLSHGFVMITLLTLTAGRLLRPRKGAMWRAFAILNLYMFAIAGFDAVFKTNYMYLCAKPNSFSLLNYFGPWPGYIAAEEVFALAIFFLLSLPFRGSKSRNQMVAV
jgi:hypothetical integral membrane protein (TIGR02206 family)